MTPVRQNEPAFRGPAPTGASSTPYTSSNPPNGSTDIWAGGRGSTATPPANQTATSFPTREPRSPPSFSSDTTRGQSPNGSRTNYETERRSTDVRGESWTTFNGDTARDRKRDTEYARLDGDEEPAKTEVVDNTRSVEILVIVILCAITFFTWTSYLDIRNKYRAALRGVPTAGGLAA